MQAQQGFVQLCVFGQNFLEIGFRHAQNRALAVRIGIVRASVAVEDGDIAKPDAWLDIGQGDLFAGNGGRTDAYGAAGTGNPLLRLLAAGASGDAIGAIPALFQSLAAGDPTTAGVRLAALLSTAVIFLVVVYVQSMKVEIPLSFGRIRGQGIRWPLSFMYTSNIPVILVAALLANFQLIGRLLQNWIGPNLFARFSDTGQVVGGFVYWVQAPDLLRTIIEQKTLFFGSAPYLQSLVYIIVMIAGSVVFSIFWVQTAGMDAKSQARQMMSAGLQIPGFRRDERVLESLLNRYIWPLTIMGGMAVGLLAALADLTGALSRGTGILLAVMIVYKMYEDIARQHLMDMNPAMQKFLGG